MKQPDIVELEATLDRAWRAQRRAWAVAERALERLDSATNKAEKNRYGRKHILLMAKCADANTRVYNALDAWERSKKEERRS